MTPRQRFVARGALASGTTTLLAAISHTWGGGAAPAPTIVLGMAVLLIAPAALLLGRRPRLPRIALTTAAAQVAFHGVFEALGAPVAGVAVQGSHDHHAHAITAAPAIAASAPHDPSMLAAHVVAALATIAILAYGEAAVRRGGSWIRAVARALVADASLPEIPHVIARAAGRIRPVAVAVTPTGVRGPPVLS